MSTVNPYFSHGISSEQYLLEDLIIESLRIYGNEFFYIPRKLVSKDNILGEDRLSEFKQSFPIEMYFANVDSFDGQGAFLQKFGLMMEQSATVTVARRRWEQLIGKYGVTIIPARPCEGDLIYFPLSKGLFEIKFVQYQDPFYQLGKLYVYNLQIELFQYSSEKLDTGIPEIDVFESLKTFSTDITRSAAGRITKINVLNGGTGYTTATLEISSVAGSGAEATATVVDGSITSITITNPGIGYGSQPILVEVHGEGEGAELEVEVETDIDVPDSYGNNNCFKEEAEGLIFDTNNPFGDL